MDYVDTAVPVVIKPEDMAPIVDGITANLSVLLPVVIGVAAVLIGIRIVPRLLSRFTRF